MPVGVDRSGNPSSKRLEVDGAECGYPFNEVGTDNPVYAYESEDNKLLIKICMRTNLLSESGDEIRILDEID